MEVNPDEIRSSAPLRIYQCHIVLVCQANYDSLLAFTFVHGIAPDLANDEYKYIWLPTYSLESANEE